MTTEQTSTPSLRATEDTIRVVAALKELAGAGVTELATHLSMSKSTVHDHFATLRRHDYVTKDGDAYEIGPGFFEMGEYARKRRQIYEVARPKSRTSRRRPASSRTYWSRSTAGECILYRARGERAVTPDTHTGKRRYLHDTALGKAILAHLPDDRVREILDRHGLPAATPNTITDRERLHEELVEIRERGVAYCGQKRVGGLQCVAAPILGRTTRCWGRSAWPPRLPGWRANAPPRRSLNSCSRPRTSWGSTSRTADRCLAAGETHDTSYRLERYRREHSRSAWRERERRPSNRRATG